MTGKLRFLHVTTFYPPYSFGGDGAYVHRLSHALADAGHEVDVLHSIDAYHVLHPAPPAVSWKSHPRVTTHGLKSGAKWLVALAAHQMGRPYLQEKRIQQVFDLKPYDVIHYHNISLFGPGILTMTPRLAAAAKVYTTHEHWLICATHVLWKFGQRACESPECLRCTLAAGRPPQLWRYGSVLERAAREVNLFLAPSRFTATMHAERGFGQPFSILPLFVDARDDRSDQSSPHPRPYCLFVGRLERLKGVDVLLRAFNAVDGMDLLIAGAGADEARLRTLASSNPRVRFLGAVPQDALGPLYAHAVACCIPSVTYEMFPLVAIEALARRTPVVAHALGGLIEIVEESGGGILYWTEDELGHALRSLANDPGKRTELGERGFRAVQERWSTTSHLKQYFDLLEPFLERRRTGAA